MGGSSRQGKSTLDLWYGSLVRHAVVRNMYLILGEALAEVRTFYTWRFSIRLDPSQDFNDTQSRNEAGKLGSNICCALHDPAILFHHASQSVFTMHLEDEYVCVF